ncbi:MAG: M20/M25/M40 family metallo-hydrolase [Acidobacteria bacterium]|nr:M20/M25/M40 family metallo-hydrolase [Acidobacteriota bacterium]
MHFKLRFLRSLLVIGIFLKAMPLIAQTQATTKFSNVEEIGLDVAGVPCENEERLEGVKNLFIAKGAPETDIAIEDFKHVKNLVVEKKGKSKELIIIGAHYDEAGGGCGAIDNWTGIVIIANLFKTIKDFDTEKTIKFVAFGKEEKGLIGSKAMADAILKEERLNYCAMVNLDSFGMAYPQVMRNISDSKLTKLAEETAKKMEMPFAVASIEGASSDSASFMGKKIPSIGIHGLNDKWENYLHSSRDKVENVNSSSVYYGYLFTLNIIAAIDAKKCDAFR